MAQDHPQQRTKRVLRRPEVEARTGLPRSTLYQRIKDGRFPAPIRIGARAVAWREEDVEEWLSSLPEAG